MGKKKIIIQVFRGVVGLMAVGAIVLGGIIAWEVHKGYKEGQDTYKRLSDTYTSVLPGNTEEHNGEPKEKVASENLRLNEEEKVKLQLPADAPERRAINWNGLQTTNHDIVAWIDLPAVDLSYPVVQGEDNDYYLHRSIDGEYLYAGCIFLDYYNSPGFVNYNSIIYGHNMRDKTMFAKLKDYNDRAVEQSCPYFWIYTPSGDYLYRIFSVHTAASGGDTYIVRFKDYDTYTSWLKEMFEISEIDAGIDLADLQEVDGKVVTLSTCTENETLRQVVQGIRVTEISYE